MTETAKHSSQRIANSAWFVVSVYLGLLLGDLIQNGIYPAIFEKSSQMTVLPLMAVTLFFLLLSVVESYVWLNPQTNRNMSGTEALFQIARLVIYVISVLFMAFLTLSLTSEYTDDKYRIGNWVISFSNILFLYSLYNFVLIMKIWISPSDEVITLGESIGYTVFYLVFAAIFLASKSVLDYESDVSFVYTVVTIFAFYIVFYFSIWWSVWHSKMFYWDVYDATGHVLIGSGNQGDGTGPNEQS